LKNPPATHTIRLRDPEIGGTLQDFLRDRDGLVVALMANGAPDRSRRRQTVER